jgi:membrane protein required for colicin V production
MLTGCSRAGNSIWAELGYHRAMQTFTALDWGIVAVLGLSVALAFVHGLLVEVCSLAGLIGGILLAGRYYLDVTPYVDALIHEPAAAHALAFLVIALGVMLAAGIAGRVLRWILRRVGLGWADRLAGGVFGLIKGYVLVALAVAAIVGFFPGQAWLAQSQLVPYFLPGAHGSATVLPQDLGGRIQFGLHHLQDVARHQATDLERP